jgi:hypothetical protein
VKLNTKTYALELNRDELWALGNVLDEKVIRFHPYLEIDQKALMITLGKLITTEFKQEYFGTPTDKQCLRFVSNKATAQGEQNGI